ncbi:DUF2812 domain-containing protein [Marinilactibacillus sp. Marseille-P9653]|uniref:DUF2812 domain-containing protein n=1 Tax=Marinilactibacillus sp. Marseille-P9653 TaxID=2866583 RepID=UPI001CE3F818|nr:DUF2812 domain-containing protein [Marinilactibacillus sp. Marseille-P9653]
MAKSVYKLRPTDYYKMGQFESWLYDMSVKGLHLKKFGLFLAKFEKSEPKFIRYRLDINSGKKYLAEQDLFYAQNGWNLVTHYGDFSVYAAPESADIPELHTDPVEQANSLKKFEFQQGILTVISMIVNLLLAYSFYRSWNTQQLADIGYDGWSELLLSIMLVSMCIGFVIDWYKIWSTRKKLLAGKAINHHSPWKTAIYLRNSYNVIVLVIAITMIAISILSIFRY